MGNGTFPDPRVDGHLAEHFTGFKLCLTERHPDFKEASLGQTVPWAPTFLFTDGKGREVRRSVGWLGPADFLAELEIARGLHHLGRGRYDEALALFEGAGAPEAGYLAGVALFLRGKRDMDALKERWNRLRAEHPQSPWAQKASVVDDL